MNQEKPLVTTAQITGIESKFYADSQSSSFTLVTDKGKFRFNSKKKTGEETTSHQQFQKYGFKSGDTIEIAYFTSKESFVNPKGETIMYDKNTVAYFPKDDENSPKRPVTPLIAQTPNTEAHNAPGDLSKLWEELQKLTGRVRSLEIMLNAKQSIVPDKSFIAPVDEDQEPPF
jgi:hypothetical protein